MTQMLIALALLLHGVGHILFVANCWGIWKAETNRAGFFQNVLHMSQSEEGVIGLVWLIPVIGFVLSALGIFSGASWWHTTTLISVLISAVLIGIWWRSLSIPSALYALAFDIAFAVVLIWQSDSGLLNLPLAR